MCKSMCEPEMINCSFRDCHLINFTSKKSLMDHGFASVADTWITVHSHQSQRWHLVEKRSTKHTNNFSRHYSAECYWTDRNTTVVEWQYNWAIQSRGWPSSLTKSFPVHSPHKELPFCTHPSVATTSSTTLLQQSSCDYQSSRIDHFWFAHTLSNIPIQVPDSSAKYWIRTLNPKPFMPTVGFMCSLKLTQSLTQTHTDFQRSYLLHIISRMYTR